MTELSVTYLEDGEWLSIATNANFGGNVIGIGPAEDDVVVATDTEPLEEVAPGLIDADKGRIWAQTVSPHGNFNIHAPYSDRLVDWILSLQGVPRLYDKLKFDVIADLFGHAVVGQIVDYHKTYGPRRESVGDLLAQLSEHGPYTHREALSLYKNRRLTVDEDINAETHAARRRLLEQATDISGKLVIARSILISD